MSDTVTDLNEIVRLGGKISTSGLVSPDGDTSVVVTNSGTALAGDVGFFGTTPTGKQSITGALSTVADAPAKAVLTSIIAALHAYGLVIDSTT